MSQEHNLIQARYRGVTRTVMGRTQTHLWARYCVSMSKAVHHMEFPPATHLRPNPCVLAEQGLIPVLNFSLGDYGGTVRQIVDAP